MKIIIIGALMSVSLSLIERPIESLIIISADNWSQIDHQQICGLITSNLIDKSLNLDEQMAQFKKESASFSGILEGKIIYLQKPKRLAI